MKKYSVNIRAEKWSEDLVVTASSIHVAVSRAAREYRQKNKGKRIKELHMHVYLLG